MPVCRCACINCAVNGRAQLGAEDIEADMFDDYAHEIANQDLAAMTISRALLEVFPEPIRTTEWWSLGRINDRDGSQHCARYHIWSERRLALSRPPLRDTTADWLRCEAEAAPYVMELMQAWRERHREGAPDMGWHY